MAATRMCRLRLMLYAAGALVLGGYPRNGSNTGRNIDEEPLARAVFRPADSLSNLRAPSVGDLNICWRGSLSLSVGVLLNCYILQGNMK